MRQTSRGRFSLVFRTGFVTCIVILASGIVLAERLATPIPFLPSAKLRWDCYRSAPARTISRSTSWPWVSLPAKI
jgi:hypothetical protein